MHLFSLNLSTRDILNNKGMTLVEVILVIVIMAIALPPIIKLYSSSMKHSATPDIAIIGTNLAQSLMEEIRSKKWDENSSGGKINNSLASIGTDSGETQRSSFDDVDDFNALNENPPKDINGTSLTNYSKFTRTVSVAFVDSSMNSSASNTDFKKITVSVDWGSTDDAITLIYVASNY